MVKINMQNRREERVLAIDQDFVYNKLRESKKGARDKLFEGLGLKSTGTYKVGA